MVQPSTVSGHEERRELSRVKELGSGIVVWLRMRGVEGGVTVEMEAAGELAQVGPGRSAGKDRVDAPAGGGFLRVLRALPH